MTNSPYLTDHESPPLTLVFSMTHRVYHLSMISNDIDLGLIRELNLFTIFLRVQLQIKLRVSGSLGMS